MAGCHSCDRFVISLLELVWFFVFKTTDVILLGCGSLVFSDCDAEECTHSGLSVDMLKAPGVVGPQGSCMTGLALEIVGY